MRPSSSLLSSLSSLSSSSVRARLARSAVTRSAVTWWLAAGLLALVTALVVAHVVGGAEARLDRLGPRRVVAVVVRPVEAGDVLRAADVERRLVPAAFVPAGPVVLDAVGRTAVVPLLPGEVVLRAKVAPGGISGIAALLPRGTRAIAVPRGPGTPRVRRGDVVDVLATFTGDAPAPGGDDGEAAPTFPVALHAPVVGTDADTVTVAVDEPEAARVAFALAAGTVTLVLVPPGG